MARISAEPLCRTLIRRAEIVKAHGEERITAHAASAPGMGTGPQLGILHKSRKAQAEITGS
jgi:hypothetical protein